jgi:drug/metabolite transporter (DMT)-like permease
MSPAIPMIVLSVGVLGVSFGSIFARYADAAPALVRSAYRVGISSLILAPYALMFHRREYMKLSRRDFGLCVGSGFFLALHFATWISSLDYTSVASSVILVDTIPIWIALFGMVTGRGRMSRRMWACVLLSVLGAAIVGFGDFSLDWRALKGDALAVAGAVAAAAYILCGREARAKLGLAPYVALCYGSASVFLWTVVLIGGYQITGFSGATWGAFAGAAVVSQILGHSSYNWALGYFSAGFVGIMLLGEPLGSAVLAYFLFGEVPTPLKIAGFALLLYAIVIAAREESA